MSGRYAVLVGLSSIDARAYGWDGRVGCTGAENDVDFMVELLVTEGFSRANIVTLKSEQATTSTVTDALRAAIGRAAWGDLVVFFFSGHGGQVLDRTDDEIDGLDETLCLYDRELVDDEVGKLWDALPPGTFGLMISDCCNSGTNAKGKRFRQCSPFMLCEPESGGRSGELIQIGAAHDGRDAYGLAQSGLFTLALTRVARAGLPAGYNVLCDRVQEAIRAIESSVVQQVQINLLQGVSPAFAESRPFSRPAGARAPEVLDSLDAILNELDEDAATNPDIDDAELRASAWRLEERIAPGQAAMRRREKGGKRFTGSIRDPQNVTGVVLHQTGFSRGPDLEKYDAVTAHFIVAPGGRTSQLHPIERVLYAANEFNGTTVSIEFVGNFRSVRNRWWTGQPPNDLSQAQVDSGKALLGALKSAYPQLRYLYGHIQSRGIARGNDPGPDLWCTVAEYAIRELGYLEDISIHTRYGGLPIPAAWRTWTPKLV